MKLQELKGKTVEGKVTRASWAIDPKVRTLRVEIDIPNPAAKLQPGLYAYATVIAEEHPEVLTVPATAVVRKDKAYCVAVVAGKAVRRPIEVGLSDGTRTEVVSGLDGSDRGESQRRLARGRTTRGSPRSRQCFFTARNLDGRADCPGPAFPFRVRRRPQNNP